MNFTFLTVVCLLLRFTSCEETYDCSKWRETIDFHGAIIFVAGDKDYIVPRTIEEVDTQYCQRQLVSLEEIRQLGKHCLKPFPKQVIGLATYGSRKDVKSFCKNGNKQEFLKNDVCFRNADNLRELHGTMDDLIIKQETIRDHVTNNSLKLPYICCSYNEYLDIVESRFSKKCPGQMKYWIDMVERKLDDAMDLMCHGFRRQSPEKCVALAKENPLVIPANAVKKSKSVLLPMVDTLTHLGAAPDL